MTEIDLKQYLYDILTIENQIYTFHNIEKIYLKKIEKIEEDRNTVFLNDKEDYKKREVKLPLFFVARVGHDPTTSGL